MTGDHATPYARWAAELEAAAKKLQAQAKAALAAGDDPFTQRDVLDRAAKGGSGIDAGLLAGPPGLHESVAASCLEATAEFWDRFATAAAAAGWEVHGSTQRRLVARAYFVELKDDAVTVDGIPGKHSPHVPSLTRTLTPLIEGLSLGRAELQQFCDLLARAYEALGGQGEVPLEALFRQCVMLAQSTAFWAYVEPARFQPLTRQAFRAQLSVILAEGMRPSTGRQLRLTPTISRKDVWELFSPGEGRIVQVGRLTFLEDS